MSHLASIAEKLRAVRAREEEFLARFAAESLFGRPILLDWVLLDLERSSGTCAIEEYRRSFPDSSNQDGERR